MNFDKLLARMRQEHQEMEIAIRVFDRMTGGRVNGHATKRMAKLAEAAASQLATDNGSNGNGQPERGRYPSGKLRPVYQPKPLPEVTTAKALQSLAETPLPDAIKLALEAAGRPLDAREITSLLNRAGRKNDSRGVSVVASMMVRKRRGLKKNKAGNFVLA